MKRLDRIRWTYRDLGIKMEPGRKISMFELGDNVMKSLFRVNDDELDFISEQMTEEESDLITKHALSFGEIRCVIIFRNKYLKMYADNGEADQDV